MATMNAVTNKAEGKVVAQSEWVTARKELLRKEKELTHLRDEISRQRRALPWEKVEKNYVFDGPRGKESLSDLFGGGMSSSLGGSSVVERNLDRLTIGLGIIWIAAIVALGLLLKV